MKIGDKVKWSWGNGTAEGRIVERFERRVQRTIKGTKVVRNGSAECPAFLIEHDDGDKILKLATEVEKSG